MPLRYLCHAKLVCFERLLVFEEYMKKIGTLLLILLTGIWILTVSLAGFTAHWGLTTWAELDIDEIILHLRAPLEGTGNGMIRDYLLKGALPAVILLAVYVYAMLHMRNDGKRIRASLVCLAISGIAALGVKNYIWKGLNVDLWIENQKKESHFIRDHYVDPVGVRLQFPEKKRNLVFLYLESMETTFADEASGGGFASNVIPELTELAVGNEDFSGQDTRLNGGVVYNGTHNTMSAIFAHTTGLPLKVDIGLNNMDTQDSFFPDIMSLGDILEKEGYRQVFLLGSNAAFGGRKLYFQDHGGFEIRDLAYAREKGWIPKNYNVWWGYEDEKLFSFARETLQELAEGDQPFNLTLLTVDTHFEDGYVCRLCGDAFGENQYANVMACSDRQIIDFVKWVQEQDFYNNTTIILTGDHTTMDKDFCAEVSPEYLRRTYTAYVNAASEPVSKNLTRTYCTFDTFPTTLAALGVKIKGNRLGLGVNLFSELPTLTEKYGVDYLTQEIPRRNDFLSGLEKTQTQSDALTNRVKNNMRGAVKVLSYDREAGLVELEVAAAPDLFLAITEVEASFHGAGEKEVPQVVLDKKKEGNRIYTGILDISECGGTDGEIRISMKLRNGTEFEDVAVESLQDLLSVNN